jgi:hypothetical protein
MDFEPATHSSESLRPSSNAAVSPAARDAGLASELVRVLIDVVDDERPGG